MIGVDIQGRLGNQMFQYALALKASSILRTHYVLVYYHYGIEFNNFFECNSFSSNKNRILNWLVKAKILKLETREFPNDQLTSVNAKHGTLYSGYFQSSYYFKGIEKSLKNEFQVKLEHRLRFQEKLKTDGVNNTRARIVIHVRRDDYSPERILPIEYYKRALDRIPNLGEYDIYLSGYKIRYHQQDFDFIENVRCFEGEVMDDFQFLMTSDVLILSNSSFAWWSAYLNEKATQIMAPKNWLNVGGGKNEYPKGISNDLDWIWV